MHSENTHTRRHLEMSVDLVQAIVNLPAVATFNWADDAAEVLLGFGNATVASVTVARVDSSGRVRQIEATGVAGARIDEKSRTGFSDRFVSGGGFGWKQPSGDSWSAPTAGLRDDYDVSDWSGSATAGLWESAGASDLLITTVPLALGDGARVLIVEIGAGPRGFEPGDVGVLSTVVQPLARRATLAFGADAGAEVRKLTPREEQVLSHLTLGKSVKQIAADLRRSPHTVHDHVKSLHAKLGASSRGELIARALGHVSPAQGDDEPFRAKAAAA